MTARRWHSSPVDPRRLSMLDHERARQTPGERGRIHGPILPLDAGDGAPRWRTIAAAWILALVVIAMTWTGGLF